MCIHIHLRVELKLIREMADIIKRKNKEDFLCKELCSQESIMVLFESEFSLFRVNIVNSRIKHRPRARREDGSKHTSV